MNMVEDLSGPAPLRLPAILQNPTNPALRQVEAHNAQQRERIAARRDRERDAKVVSKVGERSGRGKRVIRRLDNASFASNPHIVNPSRSDYAPPVPLQTRPARASFPSGALPRSTPIPSAVLPNKDPRSSDSLNGAFSMSLKGTRALLRKRGRRVEHLVGRVEKDIRAWLDGEYELGSGLAAVQLPHQGDGVYGGSWRVIDDELLDPVEESSKSPSNASALSTSPTSRLSATGASSGPSTARIDRRLPIQHQITSPLPALPTNEQGQVNAVLEYSRSPAHLTWYIHDGFERLVVHLLCRYYELISWSEHHKTLDNHTLRITQIIKPFIARPSIQPDSYHLLTPETSELSSQSGPESGVFTSDSEPDVRAGSRLNPARGGGNGIGSAGLRAGERLEGGSSTDDGPDTATERGEESESELESESVGYLVATNSDESRSRGVGPGADAEHHEGDTTITSLSSALGTGMGNLSLSSSSSLPPQSRVEGAETNGAHLGLGLERTLSNSSMTSSRYASSEGGSEYSLGTDSDYISGMGDSYVLPGAPSTTTTATEGWSDLGSDVEEFGFLPPPPQFPGQPQVQALIHQSAGNAFTHGLANGTGSGRAVGGVGAFGGPGGASRGRGWEDKPTFFEYLYGA